MYNSFDKEPKIKVNPANKIKPFTLLNNVFYMSSLFDDKQRTIKKPDKNASYKEILRYEYSKGIAYNIQINKGYNWNGANIPRFLWRIVGSQYNPEFLPASMVHDWLCEHKDFIIKNGVKISSDIFKDILILYGVSKFKAKIMAAAVKCFQMTQKGWK